MSILCPVCGSAMDIYRDHAGNVLTEEGEVCSTGHYSMTYQTGVTEIVVGEQTWTYGYRDDVSCIWKEINEAIERLKDNL